MRWSNLFVIFRREVRDQIRDRRTLFMIFVLPILLYPILGIGVIKFAMALEQKPRVVIVVGAGVPARGARVARIRPATDSIRRFSTRPPRPSGWSCGRSPPRAPGATREFAQEAIRDGDAAAVMVIPDDLPRAIAARE